jgi:hypothetical protein
VARNDPQIQLQGWADFRRDLKAIDRDFPKEANRVLKAAVGEVAVEAAVTAPRRTGRLSRSYRPFTRGMIAGVRSTLPYAPVIEYGGTISPRGVDITFPKRETVTRAAERRANDVVDKFGDGIEDLARRHGWHR